MPPALRRGVSRFTLLVNELLSFSNKREPPRHEALASANPRDLLL